jgi:hypothetical protein
MVWFHGLTETFNGGEYLAEAKEIRAVRLQIIC